MKIHNKYMVWLALALPAAYIGWRYYTDAISYGKVIHETGHWSAWLLVLTLCVTPIRLTIPKIAISRWLMMHRRALGVASFGYAAFHTVTYLFRKQELARIIREGSEPGLLTGWLALLLFLLLAITSNDVSVKKLKRGWKRLHRTVYIAAGLTFLHWVLAAYDFSLGIVALVVVVIAEGWRMYRSRQMRG